MDVGLLLLPVACFVAAVWWHVKMASARTPGSTWWLAWGHLLAFAVLAIVFAGERLVIVLCSCALMGLAAVRRPKDSKAAWSLVCAGIFVPIMVGYGAYLREPLYLPFALAWFAPASIGLALWLNPDRTTNRYSFYVMFGVLFVASLIAVWRSEFRSPSALVAYAEGFEEPVDELIRWEHFGRVAGWLQSRGHDLDLAVPRNTIREAIAEGVDVHPTTMKGAIDARLVGPREWARLSEELSERERERKLTNDGPLIWTLGQPIEVWAMLGSQTLDDVQREHLLARVGSSWPQERGIGNLGDAREIAQILAQAGAADRVIAAREELYAMLERSWHVDGRWYMTGGGFSVYDDGRNSLDEEAALDALDLMAHVGVPQAVNLGRFEAHLRSRAKIGWFDLGGVSRFDVLEHLGLHRLLAEHDPQHSASERLRGWHIPVSLILLLALCAVVMRRAPAA